MSYQYLLEKIHPGGHVEQVRYTGSQRDKPKGWRIVNRRPYTFTEAGLC